MSRSHRYSPICSLLKVDSERFDKQRWHRAWRARQRAALNAAVRITEAKDVEEAFDDFNLILPREVSNIWKMEKEGKVRFSPVKYRSKQPATKSRRLCNYHIRNVALGLFTSGPRVISR